ncbi:polyketide cyclase/dehydrase [Oleiphilus messinensis]|uniref:Polyketide cyclase/dehydrase n=1 Tax=Oleiphilus messinensis TaxID=141451 RepID=A0A1Y0IG09_9GAMM|nr:SRPBCC family protein [Oleiphilus messinensis]ARU59069.1 polyketide cyclase/dehydrase [Oleiphilus messinensis]
MPKCNPASLEFLETAPCIEINTVDLPATPEEIFALFEDGDSWPKWYKAITKVKWTSSKPYGVGTTRTVNLGLLSVDEYFFEWQTNQRFAFYFTGTNLPFVKTLVEVYDLQPVNADTTRFTYTVAYDPTFPLTISGPVGRAFLARTFKKASLSLQKYLKQQRNLK